MDGRGNRRPAELASEPRLQDLALSGGQWSLAIRSTPKTRGKPASSLRNGIAILRRDLIYRQIDAGRGNLYEILPGRVMMAAINPGGTMLIGAIADDLTGGTD